MGNHVKLPRIRTIRVKETTEVDGRILSATVSREADRWFVSFTVERDRPVWEPRAEGPDVGVDLGVDTFAVLSTGESLEAPRPLKRNLKRLRRRQKKHSRKQKGSKNRRKSARRLARLHRRIRNQRLDFLQKSSTELAKTKRVIVVEDLKVRNLSASARGTKENPGKNVPAKSGLNRSILDQGWREFRRMLTYKTVWYGSRLVVAPTSYPSSRMCSACGFVMDRMPLSLRRWHCPDCGALHGRDQNAAVNLEKLSTASSAGIDACGDPSGGGTAPAPDYESRVTEAGSEYRVSRRETFG